MMEIEEQRAVARKEAQAQNLNMPFRFFCPEGETKQIAIVDEIPDFFRHEHCMKNSRTNRWDVFSECINENANCPVCKVTDRPSYFGMFLTCLDLTPYETRDGVSVPWSKKLLVVKTSQQKKFTRFHEKHGTLRGMILDMTRDGEKDSGIGNDIEFVDFMEEDELLTYETEYVDQNKKKHPIIGHEVFDYGALFPRPTEQQLRAIVGGKAEPGSREDDARLPARRAPAGRSRDEFDDDTADGAPPRRARTAVAATRGRSVAPPEEDAEEAEEAGEEAPRATRRHAPTARAATPATTRRAAPVVDDPNEEDDLPEPPPRATRTGAARAAATPARNTTRAARPDPEEADDAGDADAEEAAPRRDASSLAEKRRMLRR